MKEFTKKSNCSGCKKLTQWSLHRQILTNGSAHFLWVCKDCNRKNPSGQPPYYISKELVSSHVPELDIDLLPVIMPDFSVRCQVCGNRDAELHHWAPRHLFGDECENWPKDYLCRDCHARWHTYVTPNMAEGGKNGQA